MTKDDVLRIAREAGFSLKNFAEPPRPYIHVFGYGDTLERFAALVASERDIGWHKIVHDECEAAIKEEREACATVCESTMPNPVMNWADAQIVEALRNCAAAIRQRKSP